MRRGLALLLAAAAFAEPAPPDPMLHLGALALQARDRGEAAWRAGDLVEAERLLQAAYAAGLEDPEAGPVARVRLADRLAEVRRARGRHAEAAAAYQLALTLRGGAHGEDSAGFAEGLFLHGRALLEAGAPAHAVAPLERAAALARRHGDPTLAGRADAARGRALVEEGRLEQAAALLEAAVETLQGEERLAARRQLVRAGVADPARQQRALRGLAADLEGVPGVEDERAAALETLARVARLRGERDVALAATLQRVELESTRQAAGLARLAEALAGAARLRESLGDPAGAVPLRRRALAALELREGPQSDALVPPVLQLARALAAAGRPDEARQELARARHLLDLEAAPVPRLQALGDQLLALGALAEAEPLVRAVLARQQVTPPSTLTERLEPLRHLKRITAGLGRWDEADQVQADLLRVWEEHADAGLYQRLGHVAARLEAARYHATRGRPEAARAQLGRAEALLAEVAGPGAGLAAWREHGLLPERARAHLALGERARAEELLGAATGESAPGPELARVWADLAEAYQAAGDAAGAARCRRAGLTRPATEQGSPGG